MISPRLLICVAAFATPAVAAAPAWRVSPQEGRVSFAGTQSGKPFQGRFDQWKAQIAFDPADLVGSKAVVVFATASAKTGDRFQETTLAGAEWFNSAAFPTATYTTSRIRAAGPGKYVADGVLQIKGRKVMVQLPFTLAINGNKATMSGDLALDRAAVDIGMKSDPTGAWVSKVVRVQVRLTAQR